MASHDPYPVFLNLAGQPVLIVGAGPVGLRKARGVLAAGGRVTVASPEFAPEWSQTPAEAVRRIQEAYRSGPAGHMALSRWRLAFAATNVPEVNALVADDAAAAGILCCRCDLPQAGDFSNAAVWQREGLTVAVSTAGYSPALAARIRDSIADTLDPIYVQWCELLAQWRPQVFREVSSELNRRSLLRQLAWEDMENVLRGGGPQAAQAMYERLLTEAVTKST